MNGGITRSARRSSQNWPRKRTAGSGQPWKPAVAVPSPFWASSSSALRLATRVRIIGVPLCPLGIVGLGRTMVEMAHGGQADVAGWATDRSLASCPRVEASRPIRNASRNPSKSSMAATMAPTGVSVPWSKRRCLCWPSRKPPSTANRTTVIVARNNPQVGAHRAVLGLAYMSDDPQATARGIP